MLTGSSKSHTCNSRGQKNTEFLQASLKYLHSESRTRDLCWFLFPKGKQRALLSRNFALSEAFIPSCIESIDGFMVVFFIHHVPTGPDRILARCGLPLFYIFAGENVMSLFYGISSHYYSFLFSTIDSLRFSCTVSK